MEQGNTGIHSFMVSGHRFDVYMRYHLMRTLGQGAYGVVCSALDIATNRKVAIKKRLTFLNHKLLQHEH